MRIAVVGAGSIGLAVAWRAAQAGAEVVVHDPDPGSGASRVAAGMIAPVTESHYGEEALGPFMAESADAWPAFARELAAASGLETGFRDVPTLLVGVEDGDRAEIDRQLELYRCTARHVEVLTARAARKAEPLLSHRVRGGLLAAQDRAVDPRAVHDALLVAAARAGVELRAERVEDPALLDADQVVIAAGCGSAPFAGAGSSAAGWTLPVRPVRGAVLRLRAVGDQPVPRTTVRGWVKGHPIYIVTRESGEVVVGATSDERGFDRHTGTAGAVHDLLRLSIELVPEIAEYHLDEVTVGFRPGTPDNLPLIGRLDDRTVAATGHYRNGIALIPATANAVAALLRGEAAAIPTAFDPGRFGRRGRRSEDHTAEEEES
jgi:glycine oxidase